MKSDQQAPFMAPYKPKSRFNLSTFKTLLYILLAIALIIMVVCVILLTFSIKSLTEYVKEVLGDIQTRVAFLSSQTQNFPSRDDVS